MLGQAFANRLEVVIAAGPVIYKGCFPPFHVTELECGINGINSYLGHTGHGKESENSLKEGQ